MIKLFAELLERATEQDLLSLLKFENTKRRILHVRQLHSECESPLGQHDSTVCSVGFRSVPSSSFLVWQSLTKRTEIHGVPPFIGKPIPLEVALLYDGKVTRHIAPILCRLLWNQGRRVLKVILISRVREISQSRTRRSFIFPHDTVGRFESRNFGIQQF